MVEVVETRRRVRLFLRVEPVGIRLHDVRTAPLWLNGVLVNVALLQSLDEDLPNLAVADALHRMAARVPLVEIADDAHGFRVRCPYGEAHTILAVLRHEMRAEHLISVIVRSLMKKIQVELTQI